MNTHPQPINTPAPMISSGLFTGASPKLTFVFGIVTGVACTAIIGMLLLLPGWGKSSTKTASVDTSNTNTAAAAAANPTFSDVKAVDSTDYVFGKGKVSVISYIDLECPYCKQYSTTESQLMADYGDRVQFVERHFPLTDKHPEAQKEAEAALCIGKLGGTDKYFKFISNVYNTTSSTGQSFTDDQITAMAKDVGVNTTKFNSCLSNHDMASRVTAETNDGSKGGANGTPTILIVDQNGKTITGFPGAYPYASIKAALDSALAAAT